MNPPSRRPSRELPPHVDGSDPRTLAWRIDKLEDRVSYLEVKPTAMEQIERLPWDRVIWPLLLVIALKAGWISSDIVQSLLGR